MESKWRILVSTGPLDKDYLEAEAWYGDELWAVLTEFSKVIEIYPRRTGEPWSFNFDDVLLVLQELAKKDLNGTVRDESS